MDNRFQYLLPFFFQLTYIIGIKFKIYFIRASIPFIFQIMIGPKDQTNDQTPVKVQKLHSPCKQFDLKVQKSLQKHFNKEKQFETAQRQEYNSFNDLESFKKQLRSPNTMFKVYELIQTSAVIIDDNCEPESFNKAFSLLVGTKDKFTIQKILQNIQIFRMDKASRIQLKLKKSEYSQQSVKSVIFSLQELMKKQRFMQKFIITEFKSERIKGSFQIDIFPQNRQYLLTFTDVEDLEKQLIKKTTDSLMHQIFRSFSHEFSTSLNAIQTIGHAAQNNPELEDICQKFINPILNSAQILKSILSDVKDYSMILSKNFTIASDIFNLRFIILQVFKNFQSQMELKGIGFQLDGESSLSLDSDIQRISQILNNLISNAQKFSEKGCIKVKYQEEILYESKFIHIIVEDEGSGMDLSEEQRLEEFLGSDLSKRKQNGINSFGIGLLISNQIALQLSRLKRTQGGGIHFETNLGVGSKFWFRVMDLKTSTSRYRKIQTLVTQNRLFKATSLKVQEDSLNNSGIKSSFFQLRLKKVQSENQPSVKSSSEYSMNSESEKRGLQYCNFKNHFTLRHPEHRQICDCASILIVDDEYINIYSLKLLLQSFNLKIDSASNGYEGANKVMNRLRNPCDICQQGYKHIIMDIEMPIWNGLKAAQAIKEFCEEKSIEIPDIIACTAYVDQSTQSKCQKAGMSYFLPKPISKAELKEALSLF